MYFAAAFLASLLLSANALATPHDGQGLLRRHHHAALAKVRAASPEPIVRLEASAAIPTPKGRLRKRCQSSGVSSSPAPPAFNAAGSPTATSPPSPSQSSGDIFHGTQTGGDGTFYEVSLGACGIQNQDSDMVAAVSMLLFDNYPGYNNTAPSNPNTNPVCNKSIKATYQGKEVTVTIVDRCVGCASTSIDFSPAAFNQLADPAVGRIHDIKWTWL